MAREDLRGDELFVVRGLVSLERCRGFIADAEGRGFEEAPINTEAGAVRVEEVRNNTRVMVDDVALAQELWEVVRGFVPTTWDGWSAVGLNERFRIYRYEAGQRFRWHRDGLFRRHDRERSFLTAMLYLNEDFEGGATEVLVDEGLAVQPETGTWLFFHHPLMHQGAEVTAGRKYVLRTDVMYRAP